MVICLMLATVASAEEQTLLLEPFPFGEVDSRQDDAASEYQIMTGRVSDSGSSFRAEGMVSVSGDRQLRVYEIPRRHSEDEIFVHFLSEVTRQNGQLLFQCEARNCGRSNNWANQVFDNRILYGRDRDQRYLAARITQGGESYLVDVYVVRRGNQRLYARVEQVRYDKVLALEGDAKLLSTQLSVKSSGEANADGSNRDAQPAAAAPVIKGDQQTRVPAAVEAAGIVFRAALDTAAALDGVTTLIVSAEDVQSSRRLDSRMGQWFAEIESLGLDSSDGRLLIGGFSDQPNYSDSRNMTAGARLGSLLATYLRRRYVNLSSVDDVSLGPWRSALQLPSDGQGDTRTTGLNYYVELIWLPSD